MEWSSRIFEDITDVFTVSDSQVKSGQQTGFWPRRCVMRSQEEGLGGAIMQGRASAVNSSHRVLAASSVKPTWRAL